MRHDINMPTLVKLVILASRDVGVDVDLVPFFIAKGIKIAKSCDLRPAGIVDKNIKTSKYLHSLFNHAATIFYRSDVLASHVSTFFLPLHPQVGPMILTPWIAADLTPKLFLHFSATWSALSLLLT